MKQLESERDVNQEVKPMSDLGNCFMRWQGKMKSKQNQRQSLGNRHLGNMRGKSRQEGTRKGMVREAWSGVG